MQPGFDFSAPVLNPQVESPVVPHAPIAPSGDLTAKHCSAMGAQQAEKTRNKIWAAMLMFYAIRSRTDVEQAELVSHVLGRTIAPSTISARRKELIQQERVESAKRSRKNQKTGVSNSLWQLKAEPQRLNAAKSAGIEGANEKAVDGAVSDQ